MNTKSPVRGMDVDFTNGDIFITTFDGYFSRFKMSNPASAVNNFYSSVINILGQSDLEG